MPYLVKDKMQFLVKAAKILSSSIDYHVTLASVANLLVSNVAELCVIDIIENGKMKRVVVKTADPYKQKIANEFYKYLPDQRNKRAVYDAARIGGPIIIRKVTKKWLKTVSRIPEEIELHHKLKLKSIVFTPLISRGNVIGVLTIASTEGGRSYSERDADFFVSLATRAGLAVDNARLYTEAQEAIRMRDEFLSIASHELRTPLTSILLAQQSLSKYIRKNKRSSKDDKKAIKSVEIGTLQIKKLSSLINDLLNVSVISAGKFTIEKENTDLVAVVKDVILGLEVLLFKNKTYIKLIKENSEVSGMFDRVRIEEVLTNLITNAIKYGNEKPITVVIGVRKKSAIIKISDQGIGMNIERQKNIFDLFSRAVTAKNYKGMGIGLYVSKQITEAHGGRLTVESVEGKGSTFTVELPLEK